MFEFVRVAAITPALSLGDPEENARRILKELILADKKGCDLAVLPELALTGCTCADLFLQPVLHQSVGRGLDFLVKESAGLPGLTFVIGLPVWDQGRIYNCAGVISNGRLFGLTVKSLLSWEESRWFTSGSASKEISAAALGLGGTYTIPLDSRIVYDLGNGLRVGVELGGASPGPLDSSSGLALAGARVILRPAGIKLSAGKMQKVEAAVRHQSHCLCCGYVLSSAGALESTTTSVYSGLGLITCGNLCLDTGKQAPVTEQMLVADIDLDQLNVARNRNPVFRQQLPSQPVSLVMLQGRELRGDGSLCLARPDPFLPHSPQLRKERCEELFRIQVEALKRRLEVTGCKPVLGISGGLDSTLALLVAVEANRRLGRSMSEVHGLTMPCFGTSDRTLQNAKALMDRLGVTAREISIGDAVLVHFQNIGHDPGVHDTTYENVQARERTQILMDYAGQIGGLAIGTGDMSELALGWCTYNGDHMSMYSVNSSIPKTLISEIIATVSTFEQYAAIAPVLADILDTPISPELLPADQQGRITQKTEDLVGPYILNDFFLYHTIHDGWSPGKLLHMGTMAFQDRFDAETVKKWLKVFCRRFFSQQFKRNCQPDGPTVGSVSLDPRGGWIMASDVCSRLWKEEADKL